MDIVHIRKAGNLLQVIPDCYDFLRPALTFTRRVQRGRDANRAVYEEVELCELRVDQKTGQRFLKVPSGLRSRVKRALRAFNQPFDYVDLAPVQLEDPEWPTVSMTREGQDAILAKIATCDMGQIQAPTGEGKTWIIVQICKLYPHSKIVVVAPGIGEVKTIRDRMLAEISPIQVGQLGGGRHEQGRRILLCVKNSLRKAEADLAACKILIYDECHTAAGQKTSLALTAASRCKMFGFTASPEMRTDRADMVVEALFGPVIHVTTYQESQKRGNIVPIRVIVRPVTQGPQLTSKNSTVLNRHGIWRNKYRNQLIADDARRFSADGQQILVTVETVEHALELYHHLRGDGFILVYSFMDKHLRMRYEKTGVIHAGEHPMTTKERMELQEQFETGALRRVISTCWNQGVDFKQLEVLIRADGLASALRSIQVPGRLSRTIEGKDYGLLIDYYDEFNGTLNNRAKGRIRVYNKSGWNVQLPKVIGVS
ncbi:hypothetical protein LCGC14_0399990 [marine sediment metagenome]|uniref:Helicase/UvrB N-terminal domain-containing protein n=1 Tax=marine sediment metagenome TaxID=412755 RepID=A0A0F9TFD6_9ZZZZ